MCSPTACGSWQGSVLDTNQVQQSIAGTGDRKYDFDCTASIIILDHARELITIQELTNKIIDILQIINMKGFVSKEKVLSTVLSILKFEKSTMTPITLNRLNKFQNEIIGNDFHSLMERYVGMDMLLDIFVKDGKIEDMRKKEIDNLAEQALNPDLLIPELKWLVTSDAKNGYSFGYELGKKDDGFRLLPVLIDSQRNAQQNASAFFLGGYFLAIFEGNQSKWELELEKFGNDEKLNIFIPELIWRSGLTDKSGLLVLEIIQKGIVDFTRLAFFKYGSAIVRLSEPIFAKWIDYLITHDNPKAIFILLDLYHVYYVHRKTNVLPKELTLKILTHKNILNKSKDTQYGVMDDFHWTEIGKAFVKQYPHDSLILAEKMFEHYDAESFFGDYGSQSAEVLNEIGKKYPIELWKISTKYLGPPIDSRAVNIEHWLRGGMFDSGKSLLENVPSKEIWPWVDEDVENRAWYLASFVPPKLDLPLIKEILIRYGGRKDVQRNLIANFQTGVWSGSISSHFEDKKHQLIMFGQKEDHPNIKKWVNFYLSALKEDMSRAKESEEREF